nr:hypothetical protein NG677_12150 [Methylobacterium sp. OTU13CASTA1]
MQRPSHIVSVEWMRDLFRVFEDYMIADQNELPPELARVIHNPPANVEGLKQWIHNICSLCKTNPSHLARHAKLSPSTVNRFLKSTDSNSSLNAKTIVALESSAADLARKLLDEKLADWQSELHGDPLYDHPRETLFQYGLKEMPLLGMMPLNGETLEDDFRGRLNEKYKITVPSPFKYQYHYLFAFELPDFREDRIDLLAREFVVCVPTWFEGVVLNGNERVIIVTRPRFETVSIGIRDLNKDDRGNIWLMPIKRDVGVIDPSFLGREAVPLIKDQIGLALIVLGSYRTCAWAE